MVGDAPHVIRDIVDEAVAGYNQALSTTVRAEFANHVKVKDAGLHERRGV